MQCKGNLDGTPIYTQSKRKFEFGETIKEPYQWILVVHLMKELKFKFLFAIILCAHMQHNKYC